MVFLPIRLRFIRRIGQSQTEQLLSVILAGKQKRIVRDLAFQKHLRAQKRFPRVLGLNADQLLSVASIYIDDIYSEGYPLLVKNKDYILGELKKEIKLNRKALKQNIKC